MIRWKTVPWVLGVALLAVSLVAARLNTDPTPNGGPSGPPAAATPTPVGGITTMGTVDAVPGVLTVTPPGVVGMPALTVKKIPDHVREGATVNAGDVLVEFDPAQFVHQKGQADHAHTAALWTADQAAKKRNDHKLELKKAALAVEKADGDLKSAREFRDSTSEALEETLRLKDLAKGAVLDEEEKAIRRKRNVELQKAEVAVRHADLAVRAAKLDEERLTAASAVVEADVSKANAQVAVVQAQIDQATAVIESFKLRAQVTGTVEQITVAEGMTVGPATRTPLMYLIPNGPRVVRAEVEAEFAHKIDAFLGKTVTIYDAHNFTNTYTGVAKRVNRAFLPKRFGGDSLVNAPTRSLECTIEVSDPAPPGKPPLRPGQPVRVTFGN